MLENSQYGFRKSKDISDAIYDLNKHINNVIGNEQSSIGIL